jgi:hypothetical protein
MKNFRTVMIALAATAMLGSQTLAAENVGPLAPGKPASVREAQSSPNLLLAVAVAAVVAGAIAIAVSNSGDTACGTNCNPPTTGTP